MGRDLLYADSTAHATNVGLVVGGLILTVLLVIISPLATSHPDSLEWVAEKTGFLFTAQDAPYAIIPDYVVPGLQNEAFATIVAGLIGAVIVFAIMAAFPLMFTLEGTPWFQLHLLGMTFTASWEGLERVISIVLKAWISIQAVILLVSTTKFEGILLGLCWLRVPKVLVAVIGLMWRYLFILVDEAQRLMTARASRSSAVSGYASGGKF